MTFGETPKQRAKLLAETAGRRVSMSESVASSWLVMSSCSAPLTRAQPRGQEPGLPVTMTLRFPIVCDPVHIAGSQGGAPTGACREEPAAE
jgi:hypothetical protein